jgi:BlaI family transcriptional regulator, penicillinase repressor
MNRQGGRTDWLWFCLNEINKMPPKKSNTLTEAELRLMKILWRRGESAVTDLVAAMPEGEALAYNSVLTTIRILEQKGYVEHRQEGRAFVYRPCVQEHEASRSEVRHVMSRFFGNSREQLLLTLLGDEEISAGELERLKEVIRNAAPDADEAAIAEPVRPAQSGHPQSGPARRGKEKV